MNALDGFISHFAGYGHLGAPLWFVGMEEGGRTHPQAHLQTRDLARANVFDCVEVFYNRTRRHSHLGGISPEAFEKAAA